MMTGENTMITLDDLEVISAVAIVGGNSARNAREIFVLVKNYNGSGEDVFIKATFICEGFDCNILNVEGMTVEI